MSLSATSTRLSVVVPTYNRAPLLRNTLQALADQDLPATRFEVIVADDGSSDDSRDVVAEFSSAYRLKYHFQEDLGFRVAAARNAGARLASAPLLVFVDAGMLPGRRFLSAHLDAQTDAGAAGRAVIGYMYGCRPYETVPGLAEAVASMSPEDVVELYGAEEPLFVDCRHEYFTRFPGEVPPEHEPWYLYWTGNCAVPTAAFWAVGGFDEQFQAYGAEDVDLGYRLSRRGLPFALSRAAWSVDTPHARAVEEGLASSRSNVLVMLHKYETPVLELSWATCTRDWLWRLGAEHQAVAAWSADAVDIDVDAEVTDALRGLPAGERVAVFGCGPRLPNRPGVYFDFDRDVLDRLTPTSEQQTRHAIGLRTTLADGSVDTVVVTSRLRGLWPTWSTEILTEARRIGRSVRGPLADPAAIGIPA